MRLTAGLRRRPDALEELKRSSRPTSCNQGGPTSKGWEEGKVGEGRGKGKGGRREGKGRDMRQTKISAEIFD